MNLLSKILRKKTTIKLIDPVFGNIDYDDGVWVSIPIDSGDEYMITVDAPEVGPSDAQRALYKEVLGQLAGLEETMKAFLQSKIGESVCVSSLRVYSLEIHNDDRTAQSEWALEMADENEFEVHRVGFREMEIIEDGTYD